METDLLQVTDKLYNIMLYRFSKLEILTKIILDSCDLFYKLTTPSSYVIYMGFDRFYCIMSCYDRVKQP